MSGCHHGITVLNFDGPYLLQRRLADLADRWVDLSDIPGTNLLCAEDALAEIRRRLTGSRLMKAASAGTPSHEPVPRTAPPVDSAPGVTFIGSGNYHYVTYLLLEQTKRPCTLLLFDRHPDMKSAVHDFGLLTCGNWVAQTLERLPFVREVHIVGAPPLPDVHPLERAGRLRFWPAEIEPDTLTETLHGHDLYISIDKDVLHPQAAVTNWDQGDMTLERLISLLRAVMRCNRVIGVDVCGEYPVTPAERWRTADVQRRNEQANLSILEAVKSA